MNHRHAVVSLVAFAAGQVTLSNGCSSSHDADQQAHFELRGTYEATSSGRIREITFTADMHYELKGEGCTTDACTEKGSFAFDVSEKTLRLTNDATGRIESLPFQVLESAGAKADARLTQQDLVAGGAFPLVKPGTVLTPGTVEKALVTGQTVQLTNGSSCLVSSIQARSPQDSTQLVNKDCGFYEKKPCDPGAIVTYYTQDFDGISNLIDGAGDCIGCGAAGLASAFLAVGGTAISGGVLAAPAGVGAAALAAAGCFGCYNTLRDSGILKTADCELFPCQGTTAARQSQCQVTCKTAYAFVTRVGDSCQCTNNANEACCRVKCYSGTQANSSCQCEAAPK